MYFQDFYYEMGKYHNRYSKGGTSERPNKVELSPSMLTGLTWGLMADTVKWLNAVRLSNMHGLTDLTNVVIDLHRFSCVCL